MTLADLIYERSRNLPEDQAREVIEFIDRLKALASAFEVERGKKEARSRLERIRIPWEGKPIPNREELHENARGSEKIKRSFIVG